MLHTYNSCLLFLFIEGCINILLSWTLSETFKKLDLIKVEILTKTFSQLETLINFSYIWLRIKNKREQLESIISHVVKTYLVQPFILYTILKKLVKKRPTRIKEHSRVSSPVGSHFLQCGVKLTLDDVKILATSQTLKHLMILEAIFINDTTGFEHKRQI